MNTTELEKGIVGDFLMSHAMISPTPLKGVVGAKRLRPDHFTDSSARAAFELIMNFEDEEPLKLFSLISRKMGAEWTDKVMALASSMGVQAEARIAALAEAGRKRLALEKIEKLKAVLDDASEDYFFSELEKIVSEGARSTLSATEGALTAESLEDFIATPPAALDPIVDSAFERGDKVELIAPSKCRKSFFALDLALHIASGLPFVGLAIPKKRRVLMVNLEIKRDWMKRRVLSRLEGYKIAAEELGGNLTLMNCRGQGGAVREAILSRVKATSPEFVILDPRYKLMRVDEDENSGNGLIGILNLLDSIAETGAAVMIVSHDKKGDMKALDIRDRGAGSNWAARDVDCRFVMTPDKKDDSIIEVGVLARNYPPKKSLKLKAEFGRFELIN